MELLITTAGTNLLDPQEAVSYLNLADAGDYPELSNLIGSVQELAEAYTGKSFRSLST
jgi:hypothetical protein